MSEIESLRREMGDMRADIGTRLDKLSDALIKLVQIEADQRRQDEAIQRIGGETRELFSRLRPLEQAHSGNAVRWDFQRSMTTLIVAAVSSFVVGASVFIFTRMALQ